MIEIIMTFWLFWIICLAAVIPIFADEIKSNYELFITITPFGVFFILSKLFKKWKH